MNATAVIIIAIGAAVVLGALAFMTLARRTDVRGAGALSAETVRRDKAGRAAAPAAEDTDATDTAAEVEAAGVAARSSVAVAPVDTDTGITPWVPPDPDALGVSRRQFFKSRHDRFDGCRYRYLLCRQLRSLPVAHQDRWLRWQGARRPLRRTSSSGVRTGDGFFYAPEARAWITMYPVDAVPKAEGLYARQPDARSRAWPGRVVPEVPAPRVAACLSARRASGFESGCHGSQYKPSRREEGWPGPARHGPLPARVLGG